MSLLHLVGTSPKSKYTIGAQGLRDFVALCLRVAVAWFCRHHFGTALCQQSSVEFREVKTLRCRRRATAQRVAGNERSLVKGI